MAPYSSTLAWKIPWAEEPGRLQSMGSLGVGHDWATSLSLFTFMHWRRKWQPSVLAWRIPGTGKPGGLPSMGSLRVRHDWSDLAAAAAAAAAIFAAITKYHRPGGWQTGDIFCSLFWRQQVQDQGISMVIFWGGLSSMLQTTNFSSIFTWWELVREWSRPLL